MYYSRVSNCYSDDVNNETTDTDYYYSYSENHFCKFPNCNKIFKKPSRLLQHERIHTGERPFKCSIDDCNKSYARSNHLKRHIDQYHIKNKHSTDAYSCEEKDSTQKFVSMYNLIQNKKQEYSKIKKFNCIIDGCTESFMKKFQLRRHSFIHMGMEPYQCHVESCRKKFTQKSHLNRHLKIHEGYKCDKEGCGIILCTWSQLRNHRASTHKKVHNCSNCQKQFNQIGQLTKHQCHCNTENASIDKSVEVFKCGYKDCNRQYVHERNLNAHIRFCHMKLKSFVCDWYECLVSFSTEQKLKNHKIICHENPIKKRKYQRNRIMKKRMRKVPDFLQNFENISNIKALSTENSELIECFPINYLVTEVKQKEKEIKKLYNKNQYYEF